MEKKRTMTCDCGGRFEARPYNFEGLESEAMICNQCGEVTLTKTQAKHLMRIKELSRVCRAKRKVVRIGNSVGITIPEGFAKAGETVIMKPIDEHTVAVRFQSQ